MTTTGIDAEIAFYKRHGVADGAVIEMRRDWCLTIVPSASGDSIDDLMTKALQVVTAEPTIINVDDLWETMAVGEEAVVDIREKYYNTH